MTTPMLISGSGSLNGNRRQLSLPSMSASPRSIGEDQAEPAAAAPEPDCRFA